MKVIFLDIDGVLNHMNTTERVGPYVGIDATLLARFQSLLGQLPDVKVVLSSTWRKFPELKAAVEEVILIHDVTPDVRGTRGVQIRTWLAFHPEVERFAIIDDDRDMDGLDCCFFTDNEWRAGLTQEIADEVLRHFQFPD